MKPTAGAVLGSLAKDSATLDVSGWPPDYIEKLIDAGVGPILHRVSLPNSAANEILGAALTAKVLTYGALDATEEILTALGGAAREIVLLKGIAACVRHYPEPHMRLMGDIDLFAADGHYRVLQAALHDLGYRQTSELPAEFFAHHHHAMPFYHPEKKLWVEVHHALFPPNSDSAGEPCFAAGALIRDSVSMSFRGTATRCLRDELHLLYVCSHWARTLHLERGLVPIVDVLYLLRRTPDLDWDWLCAAAGGGSAMRCLALMLGYLKSRGIAELDARIDTAVAAAGVKLGRWNAAALYRIIDRYLVLRRPAGPLASEPNLVTAWDTLLGGGSAYIKPFKLPLALLFPPRRWKRFQRLLSRRGAP